VGDMFHHFSGIDKVKVPVGVRTFRPAPVRKPCQVTLWIGPVPSRKFIRPCLEQPRRTVRTQQYHNRLCETLSPCRRPRSRNRECEIVWSGCVHTATTSSDIAKSTNAQSSGY